jgi:hypothetical protein
MNTERLKFKEKKAMPSKEKTKESSHIKKESKEAKAP